MECCFAQLLGRRLEGVNSCHKIPILGMATGPRLPLDFSLKVPYLAAEPDRLYRASNYFISNRK
jgi:hypothetical protein